MKKILLLLLLATFSIQAQTLQNPTYGNVKLKNNTTDNSATKVNVQSTDGTINTISKSDLVNVVEVNDVPSLPLIGEAGKIYVVKNVNKIYRWNGTYCTELAGSDINYQSIIDALTFTPENVANKVTSIGSSANDTNYPSELAVKTHADNLVVGMLNDRGAWDASVNVFPATGGSGVGGAIRKGDMWYVSVAGTLGTKSVNVGDSFRALVNAPSQVAADWSVLEANIGYVPANDSNVVHLTGAETITGQKTFSPTISASGAIARGTYLTPSLTATANNDVLVGLDINTTFTNGAFTGTKSLPVRVTSNQYIGMNVSRNSTGGSAITISNNNGGYNFGVGSINEFFIQRAGGNIVNTIFSTGNSIIQNGGTFTDDLTNRLQVTGTVSSGTTALGNTPPTANNQLTRKDYVDTGLALKANLASPSLTGTPTAPTATAGANTTQIATTAFVTNGIATADSQNVKLTGNQTISGQKSFSLTGKIDMQTNNAFPAISVTSLGSNGLSAARFINDSSSPYSTALNLQTGLSGGVGNMALNVLNASPIGIGIFSNASNGGVSISSKSHNGDSYVSNIDYGGTGRNYVGRNNGIETYSVDKIGNVIGNSYIKRSTPATNILLAGGGDLAQGTAFNKNFGTTAGTVVEGGTLGSNAYSSTAYLPLSGGTINANNETINYKVSSNNGALYNSWYDFNNNRISFLGFGGGTQSNATFFVASENGGNIALNTTGVGKVVVSSLSGTGTRTVVADASGSLSAPDIPTAPTAPAGTNTTQIATTAFVQANSRPYKVYTALYSQNSTSNPTVVILENTLGTVTFTRSSTGVYLVNSSGLFTADKTFVIMGAGANAAYTNAINLVDSSTFYIVTKESSTQSSTDSANTKVAFEIRVYL